jgi:hypothetical protein
MESIKKLKDYANIKNDWYLNNLIYSIESEINLAVIKGKLEVYKEINHDDTKHRVE